MRRPAVLHVAESPAAYQRRPWLVVDATVLAAAIFGEDEMAQAVALMQGRALTAPHLVDYEMTNVALKKIRRERLSASAVADSLEQYAALSVERQIIDPVGVFTLGQQYGLTAYDAAYLWLAERLEAPLATFDTLLANAARQHLSRALSAD
jgi:predicted nucleic acid-binding protein